MPLEKIRIGTRGSELALWQANWAKQQIQALVPEIPIEIKIIKTQGDHIQDISLSKIGDKGLFTKAIEDSLLEGDTDIAVHSLKDLPTMLPKGLTIGAVSSREDPHDVLISEKYNSLDEMPEGASIATGSLRRKSQLLNYRNDLKIVEVRGNISTRIKKLGDAGWDGMILAYAGIKRLELIGYVKQIIPESVILPAVSQGVIAVESRINDSQTNKLLKSINNVDSEIQITAERSLLQTLEGGCQVPIGVYTKIADNALHIKAMIGSLDGKKIVKCELSGNLSDAGQLGIKAANQLLASGGREILAELRNSS